MMRTGYTVDVSADTEIAGQPLAVVSDDRFATYREDQDGYPYIDTWRIKVP
jgi:hypothetical protein